MDVSELLAIYNRIWANFESGETPDSEILSSCNSLLTKLDGQIIFSANMQGENLARFMKGSLESKQLDIQEILRFTLRNASHYEASKHISNKRDNTKKTHLNPYLVRAYERYSEEHDLRKMSHRFVATPGPCILIDERSNCEAQSHGLRPDPIIECILAKVLLIAAEVSTDTPSKHRCLVAAFTIANLGLNSELMSIVFDDRKAFISFCIYVLTELRRIAIKLEDEVLQLSACLGLNELGMFVARLPAEEKDGLTVSMRPFRLDLEWAALEINAHYNLIHGEFNPPRQLYSVFAGHLPKSAEPISKIDYIDAMRIELARKVLDAQRALIFEYPQSARVVVDNGRSICDEMRHLIGEDIELAELYFRAANAVLLVQLGEYLDAGRELISICSLTSGILENENRSDELASNLSMQFYAAFLFEKFGSGHQALIDLEEALASQFARRRAGTGRGKDDLTISYLMYHAQRSLRLGNARRSEKLAAWALHLKYKPSRPKDVADHHQEVELHRILASSKSMTGDIAAAVAHLDDAIELCRPNAYGRGCPRCISLFLECCAERSALEVVHSSDTSWFQEWHSGLFESFLFPAAVGVYSDFEIRRSRNFRGFLDNWLKVCLRNGIVQDIPTILLYLGGGDVIPQYVDRHVEFTKERLRFGEVCVERDEGSPSNNVIYRRTQYRELRDKLRRALVAPTLDDDDRLSSFRRSFLHSPDMIIRSGTNSNIEKAESDAARRIINPIAQFESSAVRDLLRDGEILVNLFWSDGTCFALISGSDAEPKIVTLEGAADLLNWTRSFCIYKSQFTRQRSGEWSRDCFPASTSPHFDVVEEGTWEHVESLYASLFWDPILSGIAGVNRVVLCGSGDTQLLMASLGLAPGIQLSRYPGLAFFLLNRRCFEGCDMLRSIASSGHCIVADVESLDIPMALLEGQLVASMFGSSIEKLFVNEVPVADYEIDTDGAVKRLKFAHFAGHGRLAPLDKLNENLFAPEIKFGTVHLSDRGNLVPPAQFAFLNVCVGGQMIDDPLDGTPAGLVPRFLLRGAEVVVAALPPVDDLWACVLGLMVTEAMATDGLPLDRALAVAKQRLGDGVPERVVALLREWRASQVRHVVLNSNARSSRRNPDACARVALDAALGNDPVELLQCRLNAVFPDLCRTLGAVPELDRHVIAADFLADSVSAWFTEQLMQGPGPAEYGALVHGMIAFGESAPTF